MAKEVHAICTKHELNDQGSESKLNSRQTFNTTTRIRRLFEILQSELVLYQTTLEYKIVANLGEKH